MTISTYAYIIDIYYKVTLSSHFALFYPIFIKMYFIWSEANSPYPRRLIVDTPFWWISCNLIGRDCYDCEILLAEIFMIFGFSGRRLFLFRCCSVNYDLETKLVRKKFLPILAIRKQVLKYKADSFYRNIVNIIAMVMIICNINKLIDES